MNYLGKVIDNFRYAYKEINAATLSGAIDVIVVEQQDGSFTCSPFHVRFGKIGVLRSREKIVEIEINGEPCDIYMKLGETGEAFFVEELPDDDQLLPEHLVCSPIHYSENVNESELLVWNTVSNKTDSQKLVSELNEDMIMQPTFGAKTFHAKIVQSLTECELPVSSEFRPIQSHFECEGCQYTPEFENFVLATSDGNVVINSSTSGKKKRKKRRKSQVTEMKMRSEEDERINDNIEGILNSNVLLENNSQEDKPDLEKRTLITSSMINDLHFFSDTDIPYGCYDNTKSLSPAQSDTEYEVFSRPKSCKDIDVNLEDTGKKKLFSHRSSWRWGELPSPILKSEVDKLSFSNVTTDERNPNNFIIDKNSVAMIPDTKLDSPCSTESTSSTTDPTNTFDSMIPDSKRVNSDLKSYSLENANTLIDPELDVCPQNLPKKDKFEKYCKTLRLTSEQIGKLDLKRGANELVFSVTTAYQGTTTCTCTLYLWRYDDKIVISDIDGTITKSDVLGHIMPFVGNVWAQNGVVKLFNKIENNGYKLLYLSARAIGQSKGTRRYLNSIIQDNLNMPDGPLFLNPTGLLRAFHREVIVKKPEEFKISCLRDLQALFPSNSNPFYAGYGNKINDVWTYQAVGIPLFRIFTINHRGVLRHELSNTFQSSYQSMTQIVDQLFPVRSEQTLSEEFSEFNYWRDPIVDINEIL